MKSLIDAVVVAALVTAPPAAFAQSNQPLTRAQVRAELVHVEKAGYNPSDWMHYPENIQAAEARATGQNGTAQAGVVETSYGSSTDGSTQSGVVRK